MKFINATNIINAIKIILKYKYIVNYICIWRIFNIDLLKNEIP